MGKERKSRSSATSFVFFSIFGKRERNATFDTTQHNTRFADKHINTRARKREREKDDVEGKTSAVVVAFVLFFASSFSLFSFSFSKMSFIGEKKKQKRIIDDEFVTGGGRRSAIRDGDDDDTER